MLKKVKAFFADTWQFFLGIAAMLVAYFYFDRTKDHSELFEKQDKELKEHEKNEVLDDYKIEVIRKELAKKPEVKQDMTDDEVLKWWEEQLK